MDSLDSRVIRSYRPGRWFGIFGPRATVVLPPSEKARVGGVWDLVVDGAGFDVTLDTLISGGLRDLAAFALVATEDDVTHVLLRGPVSAVLVADGETVRLHGTDAKTWVERSLTGVSRLTILTDQAEGEESGEETGQGDGADALNVDEGLVRVSRIDAPRATAGPDGEDAAAPVPDEAEVPDEPEVPDGPEVPDERNEPADPADPGPTGLMPMPDRDDDPSEPDADADAEADAEAETDPGAGTIPPVARLVFSHGESVPVDRSVLVGRAPVADRSSHGDPILIRVSSPQQEVSATHLEIRPGTGADDGSLVAIDLGSTNGTVVVQPGEGPVDLSPGVTVALQPGAEIDLGDGATIRVSDA